MNKKYEYSNLKKIILESNCLSDVLTKIGNRTAGGNFNTLKKYISKYGIDISHFNSNELRIKKLKNFYENKKICTSEILVKNSNYCRTRLKERLYDEKLKERKCELCGQDENWHDKKISLILDHINGINNDNRIENLRIVCPNCNATLDTHCGRNKSKRSITLIENGYSINDNVNFSKSLTKKSLEKRKEKRKVERPSYETLNIDIKNLGYIATGRKYHVCDNTIRKWIKFYEKYQHS